MKLKFKALVLAATMFAVPAFAGDIGTDITTLSASTDLATDINTVAIAAMISDITTPAYDGQSVALVSQKGDLAFAWIDQQGGQANFAAVLQDTTTNAGAVAFVAQNGNSNRAYVNQH